MCNHCPPPLRKGGDYDFSIDTTPGDQLEVKTLLFGLPSTIDNHPLVRILMSKPCWSFPLQCRHNQKVIASHISPAIPHPSHANDVIGCAITETGMRNISIMHLSFVSTTPQGPWTAPPGPGNSRAFNFSVFKALLKARHCSVRFVVKSLLKAQVLRRLVKMWNSSLELF